MFFILFVSFWLSAAHAIEVQIPWSTCGTLLSNDNQPVEPSQLERWLASGQTLHTAFLANHIDNDQAYALLAASRDDLAEMIKTGYLRQGLPLADEKEYWVSLRPIQPFVGLNIFASPQTAYLGSQYETANYAFAGRTLSRLGVHNAFIQQIAGPYFASHVSANQTITGVLNRLEKSIFSLLNEEHALTQGIKEISPERKRNIDTFDTALKEFQKWRARFSEEQWHEAIQYGAPAAGYVVVLKPAARSLPTTPHPALAGGYIYHVYDVRGISALQVEAIIPQGNLEKSELDQLRSLIQRSDQLPPKSESESQN